MALTPKVQTSLGALRAVAVPSPSLRMSKGLVRAVYNTPVESLSVATTSIRAVKTASPTSRVTGVLLRAIVRGKIENPRVRAWSYTLDGHDFYVLKLGTEGKTLIFDLSTGQWSQWSSGTDPRWRASLGFNWRSSRRVPANYGSNVIVGDDSYGALWVLDPDSGLDDHLLDGDPVPFPRVATGQIAIRGRTVLPCFSVYLSASAGSPAVTPSTVTLEYSDDSGETFTNAGEITVNADDFTQEFSWRSLGQVRAPGRLFKISNDGALARIDSLDVNNENS